ncbi:MAG: hypothetical protein RI885_832, partial [Actinomycetota bacterium]
CLGTIWAIEVGFAFGRLDMDPSSRDAVGFLGLALAMLAVPTAVALFVRARRAEPLLSAEARADSRARRDLDDLEQHFRSGTVDPDRAAELIRPIRERWKKDSRSG